MKTIFLTSFQRAAANIDDKYNFSKNWDFIRIMAYVFYRLGKKLLIKILPNSLISFILWEIVMGVFFFPFI